MFIMKYINYVFCLCLVTNVRAYGGKKHKSCNDCTHIQNCRSAEYSKQRELSPEYVKKLNNAFCGYDAGIKVCCSELDDRSTIQKHKNIGLLPDNCGSIQGNRIFGGTVAGLYEFPWMALISYQTDDGGKAFQCAGSVINSRYILTAAHCLVNKHILGVRIGELDLRNDYDCQEGPDGRTICENNVQDIQISETIYHERYEGYPKYAFDIGLLRLARPISFARRNAAPICLPATEQLRSAPIANKMATVAGWGLTENKRESSVLLKVDIPIHPEDDCFNLYSRILEASGPNKILSQLCAGTYHKDSCKGDSGAPLIIENIYKGTNRLIQYGIVSQGPENCGSGMPAVYTAVASYMNWILDKLKP